MMLWFSTSSTDSTITTTAAADNSFLSANKSIYRWSSSFPAIATTTITTSGTTTTRSPGHAAGVSPEGSPSPLTSPAGRRIDPPDHRHLKAPPLPLPYDAYGGLRTATGLVSLVLIVLIGFLYREREYFADRCRRRLVRLVTSRPRDNGDVTTSAGQGRDLLNVGVRSDGRSDDV